MNISVSIVHIYSSQSHKHTLTLTHTHIYTPPLSLYPSHSSPPCSVFRGSTLLNCIPQPIDYLNGVSCSSVGFCVTAPHQGHIQSLAWTMEALHSPFTFPCLVMCAFLQRLKIAKTELSIAIVSLHKNNDN